MPTSIDASQHERFARLALDCVHREYPNHILHLLESDADVGPPRRLTPAFFGCFDWHSAVHGHWTLVRLARLFPETPWADEARATLDRSLTPENLRGEVKYISRRPGFEMPYGMAWLLQLAGELREWDDVQAGRWSRALEPLERLAVECFQRWLPGLSYPIRSGVHSQSAFSMGLAWDYAHVADDRELARLIESQGRSFHLEDRDGPLHLEPSGYDFLSPCLGEADLLRRFLPADEFANWLTLFLPGLPGDGSTHWLRPVEPSDRADGRLAHLDGLNLSRAWMLEAVASGLPQGDSRTETCLQTASAHAAVGLAAVTGEHYAGGHWLGTFAVYLTTRRNVSGKSA
ncbi:MAG: DUF2891 domain-containing protein [Planctomycetes bacterium]|nr:DUF2891 domain-containing protein [Planctomycetota bacterium]